MNKRATYCQKVHYTYISQKTQSFKKMNSDATQAYMKCITHTSKCDFKCCFKLPNIIISFFRLGLHRESQTLLGTVRYGSNGVGVANLIENTLLRHVCYRTTFCRFRSNCMGHNKLWGRWDHAPQGRDAADPQKYVSFSHLLSCQIRSFQVRLFESNYGNLTEDFDSSLEMTRTDQSPMTSCYCSMVTMGLSRTVFEIKGSIC